MHTNHALPWKITVMKLKNEEALETIRRKEPDFNTARRQGLG